MREDGEPVERAWRLALAQVGQVQWELVQPLDDESVYARFLAANGPGVHHIGVGVRELRGHARGARRTRARRSPGGEYNGVPSPTSPRTVTSA